MRTVEEYIETKWKEDIDEKGYEMPGKNCIKRWVKEYAEECIQELKSEVYVVIDADYNKYDDIVLGIYESEADAASVQMMYKNTVAINDDNRFRILIDKIL